MVLLALQHPGLVAALFTILVVVLKIVAGVIVVAVNFVLLSFAGNIVTWYLQKLFMLHAWPRLPHGLRRVLVKLKPRILFVPKDQDKAATRDDESAFSRNRHRHPHW